MEINNNNQVKKIRVKMMRHDTQSSFKTGTVQSVSPKRYQETVSSYQNKGFDQQKYDKTPCATPDMMMNFDPSPSS